MSEFIAVNHSVCTGCRECEVICSLFHFGECNPDRSAIRVIRKESDGLAAALPLVCQQCQDPPCLEACPTGAISQDSASGVMAVDPEACTGCADCLEACPAGCIFMDVRTGLALCCDLCGGNPQCVALCHSRGLTLTRGDESDRAADLARVLKQDFRAGPTAGKGGA